MTSQASLLELQRGVPQRAALVSVVSMVTMCAVFGTAWSAGEDSAVSGAAADPALSAALSAGASSAGSSEEKVLTNSAITAMVAEHVDDETLVRCIEGSQSRFDVSPAALGGLKRVGVSDRVLGAMLKATRRDATPSPPSTVNPTLQGSDASRYVSSNAMLGSGAQPTSMMPSEAREIAARLSLSQAGGQGLIQASGMPASGPRVYLIGESGKQEFGSSSAERSRTDNISSGGVSGAGMLRTIASTALRFGAIGAGPAGMMAVSGLSSMSGLFGRSRSPPGITYAWGVAGLHANRMLPSNKPSFEVIYKEIPGIDPDAFQPALVRTVPTPDNYRLLGVSRQKGGSRYAMSAQSMEWIAEDRIAVRIQNSERGVSMVQVQAALAPGDYALVLRPSEGYREKPSGFGNSQLLTAVAWDFAIGGAVAAGEPQKSRHPL